MSEPTQEQWFKSNHPCIRISLNGLLGWLLKPFWMSWHPKSPIKWSQRPDMTMADDWDVEHQFKTNRENFKQFQNTPDR